MSKAAAQAFVDKMKTDEEFKKKIMAMEDVDQRMKLINSEGFDCTADEINELSRELSSEEIEGLVLSGGWGYYPCYKMEKTPHY